MIRWLRVTWPPGWALALAALLWAGFDGGSLLLERGLGIPYYTMDSVKEVILGVASLLAAGCATFRVAAFHPAFRPGYRQWLCDTPWTSRKPLPLGPIHLVPQDVLLIAISVGLAWPWLEMQAAALDRHFSRRLSASGDGRQLCHRRAALGVCVPVLVRRDDSAAEQPDRIDGGGGRGILSGVSGAADVLESIPSGASMANR